MAVSSSPQGDVNHTSRSLDIALGIGEKHQPYEKLKHPVYYQMASRLKKFEVGRMDRREASGVMSILESSQILKRSKFLRSNILLGIKVLMCIATPQRNPILYYWKHLWPPMGIPEPL